jgi:hypothetical protein
MGWPTGRESYGYGVPIVVVGVMPHQGERESRSQGEVGQVIRYAGTARYARCEAPKRYCISFETEDSVDCRWRTSIDNSTTLTCTDVPMPSSIPIKGP